MIAPTDSLQHCSAIFGWMENPDWWIALANIGIISVLVGHWRAFKKQAGYLKDTVKQMVNDGKSRESFEKTKSRARISITLEDDLIEGEKWIPFMQHLGITNRTEKVPEKWIRWFNEVGNNESGVGWHQVSLIPTIRNIGETSAVDVEFHGLVLAHVGMSKILTDNYKLPWTLKTVTLTPGESFHPEPIKENFHPDNIADFKNTNTTLTLCFCGRIKFKDIFGDEWTQLFGWDIVWHNGIQGEVNFRKTNDWNKEISGYQYPLPKTN